LSTASTTKGNFWLYFPYEPYLHHQTHYGESQTVRGKPCIRGMRIRVVDVLDLLANGLTLDEVLSEFPKLECEDILDCIRYARQQMDHVVSSSKLLTL
jgi:uncharacterized protein (DUF433 family)